MDKHLHIVCPDIPYPVDYGGVFDVFYKLKALAEAGVLIHLHCYEKSRARQTELNRYCSEVIYYRRLSGFKGISAGLPYIVSSRRNPFLLKNLLRDDHPILLEGVHTSSILFDTRFKSRKIVLRLFNVEYLYYRQLFETEKSRFKKLYYLCESQLLYGYEKRLAQQSPILALSEADAGIYRERFNAPKISYVPAFLPFTEVLSRNGVGDYCLYHGNLSVAENEEAVMWLLTKVFDGLKIAFVVAGKAPSERLQKECTRRSDTCLVANPSDHELQDLIAKAQINVLPSFNKTGVKLKLLNALFNGRHCVINEAAALGTSMISACHVGNSAPVIKEIIVQLFYQPFTDEEIMRRKIQLSGTYDNSKNVQRLIQSIW